MRSSRNVALRLSNSWVMKVMRKKVVLDRRTVTAREVNEQLKKNGATEMRMMSLVPAAVAAAVGDGWPQAEILICVQDTIT